MNLALFILSIVLTAALLGACSHVRNFDTTEQRIIQADRDIAKLQSERASLVRHYAEEHDGKQTPLK